MTSILGRIFSSSPSIEAASDKTPNRYDVAMAESGALLERMRSAYASKDAVRQVLADIWQQSNNIPYSTTVFQATQELNAAVASPEKRGK